MGKVYKDKAMSQSVNIDGVHYTNTRIVRWVATSDRAVVNCDPQRTEFIRNVDAPQTATKIGKFLRMVI